ncbi:hypothetical protein SteCoe_29096 [Stentor coeruleus]|uniref:Uncharacterized protein n=1 Tax=Stentor coeruleus TaxID=5963 RepID=A0A1R2B6S9_9CILI|nr:hypothetical protein SteCoe_29096 [Stentor coeruleus]
MKNRYNPIDMHSQSLFEGIGKRALSERLPGLGKHENPSLLIINRKHSYVKFYENFEKMCDTYKEIPDIKFDNETSKEKTTPKHQGIKKDKKLSYIIKQLKQRIKACPAKSSVCIKLDRFKTRTNTEENIGPGSYSIITPKISDFHEFSMIPRLKSPISHNIYLIQATLPKKHSDKSCIWRNKNLVKNHEFIKEKKESLNFIKNNRGIDVKIVKDNLDQHNREEKIRKINQKVSMFEKRMRERNVVKVQKSWILLITILSFSGILNFKVALFYKVIELMIR